MIILLWIFLGIMAIALIIEVASAIVCWREIQRAPDGWEDDSFHYGRRGKTDGQHNDKMP